MESVHIRNSEERDLHYHLHSAARYFLADLARRFGPPNATLCAISVQQSQCHPHPVFRANGETEIIITTADELRAKWQLAHECVHLLDPWVPSHEGCATNVLEEGIATWFQNAMVEGGGEPEPKYKEAQALVASVIASLASAVMRLRTQRTVKIGAIAADSLREYCPLLTEKVATALCRRFRD